MQTLGRDKGTTSSIHRSTDRPTDHAFHETINKMCIGSYHAILRLLSPRKKVERRWPQKGTQDLSEIPSNIGVEIERKLGE